MSHSRIISRGALLLITLAYILAPPHNARAESKTSYYFLVHDIKLAENHSDEVREYVRTQLTRAIQAHPRLLEALPEDAPDPEANAKQFAKYIERKNIRPFRVDVEVVDYEEELEQQEAPRRGQVLTVRLAVRIFGESLPKHTFGFTGEGAATIKMEVGKKLRKIDRKVVHEDAAAGAAADALTMALTRLDEKEAKGKKGRKGKRKTKK